MIDSLSEQEEVKFSDVRIGFSVLSGDVYLYVPDEKGLAKIKKPCEFELMTALVGHMMQSCEDAVAVEKEICLDDRWYKISVEKIEEPEEDEEVEDEEVEDEEDDTEYYSGQAAGN